MKKILLLFFTLTLLCSTLGWGQTTVNFDSSSNWIQDGSTALTSYGNHSYTESGATVQGTNVLRNTISTQDGYPGAIGTNSMRIGNTSVSKVVITISTGGVSNFTLKVRRWDGSPIPNYTVKYSTDGANWSNLTSIDGTLLTTSDWFTYSETINNANSNIKIEIANTGTTERIMIDDFIWTSYSSSSATIESAPAPITESNLNGSVLTLNLSNETFLDASLSALNFTLNNAPAGTTISNVSYVSTTQATVTLAFDGTDFDSDISDFNVTIAAAELTGGSDLSSNSLTITAHKAPTATTNAASSNFNGSAVLNGTVTSNGYETTVTFEYGTTLSYGTSVTAAQSPLAADASSAAISYALTGLTNGVEYHYRVVASNTEGTTEGSDMTFTPIAPINVIINEIDADSYSTDVDDFIELYDGGAGNTDLTGLVVVLFNGNGDVSYMAIDLDGESTNANGYYVIGSAQVPNVNNTQFATVEFQNGADAVALYMANASDFPNGSALTLTNLIDAIVYDTDDADDAGLLVLLNSSQPQVNENARGGKDYHSIQRIPNGTGGQRNTSTFSQAAPTPGTKNFDEVWDGDNNNDWTTAANWLNGVPATSAKIYIPAGRTNYPNITASTTIQDIVLEHNAQLNGQENLTINGNTTLKHQAVKSTSNLVLDRWQYFTSPFTGLTATNLLSSNDRVDFWMAQYDNSISNTINDAWSYASTSTAFTPGRGYAVSFVYDAGESGAVISGTDYNMSISGTLVDASSSSSVSLQYQGSGLNNWNLIGNPYLAPINWFDHTNLDYTLIQGRTIYIYDPLKSGGAGYYSIQSDGAGSGNATTGGSQYIPPMQGFFLEATAAGSFSLAKDARVNNLSPFFKSSSIENNIRLVVAIDSLYDETVILFNESASSEFDINDAHKLLSNSNAPQLYTVTKDEHQLVFNHTNSLEQSITLEVLTKVSGEYSLSLSELEGIFKDYRILLKNDKNETTLLTTNEYKFTSKEGQQKHVFTISFQETTSNKIVELNETNVFANQQQVFIQSDKELLGSVMVFSLTGQQIYSSRITGSRTIIPIEKYRGICIVQLNVDEKPAYYKVRIQ